MSYAGLFEKQDGLEPLIALHDSDLPHIHSVTVEIAPDRAECQRRAAAAGEQGEPVSAPPSERVSIRISKYETSLVVEGDDRTYVEGLTHRLRDTLGRAASDLPRFDRGWFLFVGLWPAVLVPPYVGPPAAQWLGLAEKDGVYQAAEILGWIVTGLAFAALSIALHWTFPPVEFLPEGTAGRFRRFRGLIAGTASSFLLAIIAAYVYERL